jgi:hypothetical protein
MPCHYNQRWSVKNDGSLFSLGLAGGEVEEAQGALK